MTTEIIAERSAGLTILLSNYHVAAIKCIGDFLMITFKHPVNKDYFFKQLTKFNQHND